jgi:hypothetical protein
MTISVSLKAQDNVQLVFIETTAEAINELNKLVPDYDERREFLLKMKEIEKKGVVFISSKQYEPIRKRINSIDLNASDDKSKEMQMYVKTAQLKYRSIRTLISN